MKHGKLLKAAGIAVLVVGLTYYLAGGDEENTALYVADEYTVNKGDVRRSVVSSGILRPANVIPVGVQVNGQINRILVREGEYVTKGTLLAEMDPRLQMAELRNARAHLASAEAGYRAALAKSALATQDLRRQESLMKRGAGTGRDLEAARSEERVQRESVQEAATRVMQAQTTVDSATTSLSYTRIPAPADGEVLKVMANEGQTVVSSQTVPTILVLGDTSRMMVETQISESDISFVRTGQPLEFYLPSAPDMTYQAALSEISSVPVGFMSGTSGSHENSRQTAVYYTARFFVDNAARHFRTGMNVRVSILAGEKLNVLRIPLSALGAPADENGRYYVYRLTGSKYRKIPVLTGLRGDDFVEIPDGLDAGDRIALVPGLLSGHQIME